MRRALSLVVACASLVGLAACTSLPTSGNYQPGLSTETTVQDARWQYNPNGPVDGANPAEIVLGFLDAGESPAGDWSIAREFLTDDAADAWDPGARVIIDDVDERDVSELTPSEEDARRGRISMSVTPLASLDETGQYRLEGVDGARSLSFDLAQVDGQWRISSAPDGIVVQSGNFANIFLPQTLVFSGLEDHLVSDVRWFPDAVLPVRRTVEALVEGGPAPWLEGSVTNAFDGVKVRGVQVEDGAVTVSLSAEAVDASAARRARMQTQLEQSLASMNITSVRMTVNGSRLTGPADRIADVEPDARAVVMTDDDFGYLAGGDIEEIPGLSEAIRARFTPASKDGKKDPATSISVAPDLSTAIVQSKDGTIWRVDAESATFEPLSYEQEWIAPALDPFGFAWSTRAGEAHGLWAWGSDPDPIRVRSDLRLTSVTSIAISRDGARIAIVGNRDDQALLVVAAIRRDSEGAPIAIDGVQGETPLEAAATDVAWVSPTLVAASMSGDGRTLVREQQVGGTSERLTASFDSVALSYGNTKQRERLLTADGSLYIRYQRTWQQAGNNVIVLATQVGAPDRAPEPQP